MRRGTREVLRVLREVEQLGDLTKAVQLGITEVLEVPALVLVAEALALRVETQLPAAVVVLVEEALVVLRVVAVVVETM